MSLKYEYLALRYEAAIGFFIHFIPSSPDHNVVMEAKEYKKIVGMLKNEETLVQLHFFMSVNPIFGSYLWFFKRKVL